jgi:hypothetical protein
MDKKDFQHELLQAAKKGTLLTPKHDPQELSCSYANYRSVLSTELAANLEGFILSGKYEVEEFSNKRYTTTPQLWVITPMDSTFSVPASGVDAYSPIPNKPLDSIVAVSGCAQGLHIFGANRSEIDAKVSAGSLSGVGFL